MNNERLKNICFGSQKCDWWNLQTAELSDRWFQFTNLWCPHHDRSYLLASGSQAEPGGWVSMARQPDWALPRLSLFCAHISHHRQRLHKKSLPLKTETAYSSVAQVLEWIKTNIVRLPSPVITKWWWTYFIFTWKTRRESVIKLK